jgi:hypothetical protein
LFKLKGKAVFMAHGNIYRIRVKGIFNPSMAVLCGEITVAQQENGVSLVTGRFPDQAALRGLLDHLWNLNIAILSVEQIEERDQPDNREARP